MTQVSEKKHRKLFHKRTAVLLAFMLALSMPFNARAVGLLSEDPLPPSAEWLISEEDELLEEASDSKEEEADLEEDFITEDKPEETDELAILEEAPEKPEALEATGFSVSSSTIEKAHLKSSILLLNYAIQTDIEYDAVLIEYKTEASQWKELLTRSSEDDQQGTWNSSCTVDLLSWGDNVLPSDGYGLSLPTFRVVALQEGTPLADFTSEEQTVMLVRPDGEDNTVATLNDQSAMFQGGCWWWITHATDRYNPSQLVIAPVNGTIGTLDPTDGGSATRPWSVNYGSSSSAILTTYSAPGVKAGINASMLFSGLEYLSSADLRNLDVSGVAGSGAQYTGLASCFQNCYRLKTLDLRGWNTGSVSTMGSMFNNCRSLTTVRGIESFDVSSVTGENGAIYTGFYTMFLNCYALPALDLSSWHPPQVTNIRSMFGNCYSLASLNISNFDTSVLYNKNSDSTSMNLMFSNCASLRSVTVGPSFKFSSVSVNQTRNQLPTRTVLSASGTDTINGVTYQLQSKHDENNCYWLSKGAIGAGDMYGEINGVASTTPAMRGINHAENGNVLPTTYEHVCLPEPEIVSVEVPIKFAFAVTSNGEVVTPEQPDGTTSYGIKNTGNTALTLEIIDITTTLDAGSAGLNIATSWNCETTTEEGSIPLWNGAFTATGDGGTLLPYPTTLPLGEAFQLQWKADASSASAFRNLYIALDTLDLGEKEFSPHLKYGSIAYTIQAAPQ